MVKGLDSGHRCAKSLADRRPPRYTIPYITTVTKVIKSHCRPAHRMRFSGGHSAKGTIMNLKRICALTLVFAAILASTAAALGPVGASANVSLMSKYVWRGLVRVDGPVVQPSVSLDVFGLSVGAWANMDMDDVNDQSYETSEVDYMVEYSKGLVLFEVAAGAVHYTFPVASYDYATTEVYASLRSTLPGHAGITVFRDVDEVKGTYVSLSAGQSIPVGLVMNLETAASIGWGSAEHNNEYYEWDDAAVSDFMVGVGMPFGISGLVSVTPSVIYTGIIGSDIKDTLDKDDISDSNIIFGVTASVSF